MTQQSTASLCAVPTSTRSQPHNHAAGPAGWSLLYNAEEAPCGLLAQDEQLRIEGNRAVRSVNGVVRAQYSTTGTILDAAWGRFAGSRRAVLCLLQTGVLTVVSTSGDVQDVPLPAVFQRIHPLPAAVLLSGAGVKPHMLQHPLEELRLVAAAPQPGSGWGAPPEDWAAESVVWTSLDAPLVVTANQATNACTVWHFASGGAAKAIHAPAGTPQGQRIPTTPTLPPGSVPGSAASIRKPDGSISKLAFSPLAFRAAPTPGAQPDLPAPLPPPEAVLQASALWRQQFPAGQQPTSACLAENADGCTLLCLVSAGASTLTALRTSSKHDQAHAAFQLTSVAAAAAVTATRQASSPAGRELRDLLVLHRSGQLALYVGRHRMFDVRVQAPPPSGISVEPGFGQTGEASHVAVGMASSEEDMMSVDTPAASSRQAQPVSGSGLQKIKGLRDAVGDRVTLQLEGGASLRVRLPVLPPGCAAALALAALRDALTPSAFRAIASLLADNVPGRRLRASHGLESVADAVLRWLGVPPAADGHPSGGASTAGGGFQTPPRTGPARRSAGSPTGSTAASTTAVPSPGVTTRSSARRRSQGEAAATSAASGASSGSPATPRRRPGAKRDSGVGAGAGMTPAWQLLLQSQQHRELLDAHSFQWLQPAEQQPDPQAVQFIGPELPAEAWQALEGLHALYEDCKLDALRWHLLRPLGRLLGRVAAALGARQYADRYQRDLALPASAFAVAAAPADDPAAVAAATPASMQEALRALLLGRAQQRHWVPALAQAGAPSVQRSVDLLHFYGLLVPEEDRPQTARAVRKSAESAVMAMNARGWTLATIDSLPPATALPLQAALLKCRQAPPPGWPAEAYILIGRADIATMVAAPQSAAPQKASDAAPPAATLIEGFAAAAGTPVAAASLQAAGRKRRARKSAKFMPRGDLDTEAAGSGGLTQAVLALPPYQQRLTEPGPIEEEIDAGKPAAQPGPDAAAAGKEAQRFAQDLRLLEVEQLLASDAPTPICVGGDQEAGDPELVAAQQARLLALAPRTLARPLGRGALTFGTLQPLPTQGLGVPPLVLGGRLTQHNDAITQLDTATFTEAVGGGAVCDLSAWPEFHNGVAAGLRLAAGGNQLSRTWIVYNKPEEPTYQHAGVLMALGLTGHLRGLSATDVYRYLRAEHHATTVGLLLGLGAAHAGTCDAATSTMLFLHVPSRHPQTYPELEVSPPVQAAALAGAGLLYRGSCHRQMAEIMVEEIGRRASGEPANNTAATAVLPVSSHREGYALAAGAALGLVTLGSGRSAPGISDLQLEDRLRHYMVGGLHVRHENDFAANRPTAHAPNTVFGPDAAIGFDPSLAGDFAAGLSLGGGAPRLPPDLGDEDRANGSSGVSQVVLEGELVNTAVTGPGATLALALMFLRTNDAAVAASFTLPTTAHTLDMVRPDHVLLRVVARAMVMWDSVLPTRAWLLEQLPPLIQGPLPEVLKAGGGGGAARRGGVDPASAAQAHLGGLAGGCLALGIRFAGSQSAAAADAIMEQLLYFLRCKALVPDASAGAAAGAMDKQTLEGCAGTAALALSCVLAGSGDLRTLKLLRGLARRLQPTERPTAESLEEPGGVNYGAHASVSMALGFLCLGGGAASFGTSNEAVAALLIALYPRLPSTPQDNRSHLQALRHLYVLAAEPRCLSAMDIELQQSVPLPLVLHLAPSAAHGPESTVEVDAPCLVPGSDQVLGVEVVGPCRYQPLLRHTPAGEAASMRDGSGAANGPPTAAAAPLYVQRRLSEKAPSDPPGGMGFSDMAAVHLMNGGPWAGGGDAYALTRLGQLGATLAAQQPFLSALSRYFAQELPALAAPRSVSPGDAGDISPAAQPAAAGGNTVQAAARMLVQTVVAEVPGLLPPLLFLHCLVQSLATASGSDGRAPWRSLCGGLTPALAVRELQLAEAFYSLVHQQHMATRKEPMGGRLVPLLQPAVGAAQLALEQLWLRLSFLPPDAAAADGDASMGGADGGAATAVQHLRWYCQAGTQPAGAAAAAEQPAGRHEELYAVFLESQGVPTPQRLAKVAFKIRSHRSSLAQSADLASADAQSTVLLASLLPDLAPAMLPLVMAVLE